MEFYSICDDGVDDRILIFGTAEIFSQICDAEILFTDGTFISVSKICLQLYTIHFIYHDCSLS